jgi:LmbE family N-acetylglucosaminyl deacetylase
VTDVDLPGTSRQAVPADITTDLPTPRVALAVGAHPDDIEFGCGATLAKWAAEGCHIHHLVCTDGSKGSWDADADIAALVALRQEEQRSASRALGGSGDVIFLGWTDGELESGLEQRRQIAHWIRRIRPGVVLGHDPWRRYRLHPDHRHAGFLAVDGIVASRDPHFFPELGQVPHRPAALLLWEADEVDHVEGATDSAAEAKIAALLAHHSQFRSTMAIDNDHEATDIAAFKAKVTDQLASDGQRAGLRFGEAFKLLAF